MIIITTILYVRYLYFSCISGKPLYNFILTNSRTRGNWECYLYNWVLFDCDQTTCWNLESWNFKINKVMTLVVPRMFFFSCDWLHLTDKFIQPPQDQHSRKMLMEVWGTEPWNFKINKVTTLVALTIQMSIALQNIFLIDTYMAKST
jgi:hypothetical protein